MWSWISGKFFGRQELPHGKVPPAASSQIMDPETAVSSASVQSTVSVTRVPNPRALILTVYEAIRTPSWLPLASRSGREKDSHKQEGLRGRIEMPIGNPSLEASEAFFKHLPLQVRSEHVQGALKPEIIRPHGRTTELPEFRSLETLCRPDYIEHMADKDRNDLIALSLDRLASETGKLDGSDQRARLIYSIHPHLHGRDAQRLVKIVDRDTTVSSKLLDLLADTSGKENATLASKEKSPRDLRDISRELDELTDPAIYVEGRMSRLKIIGQELDLILGNPGLQRNDSLGL